MRSMTTTTSGYQTQVTQEGRVLLPAAVRRELDIRPGDRIHLFVEGNSVHLVSARAMAESLWAMNQGGDAGEAANDVRAIRAADAQQDAQRTAEMLNREISDEDGLTAGLLTALGLEA